MGPQGSARQFLADNSFYEAAGQDDGSSEADALQRAEASLAEIRPALAALIEDEVCALVARLDALPSRRVDSAQIDEIALSSDRIIDVAETVGYPELSRVARRLRQICQGMADNGDTSAETFRSHRHALAKGLRAHSPVDRTSS